MDDYTRKIIKMTLNMIRDSIFFSVDKGEYGKGFNDCSDRTLKEIDEIEKSILSN